MVVAENRDNAQSVEHLVPNAMLSNPRSNEFGDFYACRKCNSRKSNIDYVLAVVAKVQSRNPTTAVDTFVRALSTEDGRAKPFERMLSTVRETADGGAVMEMPVAGQALLEYATFLGKGQYFKRHRKVFNSGQHVFLFQWFDKRVTSSFENHYEGRHGSNNFRDLEQNSYTEVIASGESMIYSKNDKYLFVFHDYIGIGIQVKSRNTKNLKRAAGRNEAFLKGFDQH